MAQKATDAQSQLAEATGLLREVDMAESRQYYPKKLWDTIDAFIKAQEAK
jgi:hypothetical protein